MGRVSSAPVDACDPIRDGAERIAQYLEQENGPEVDSIYCEENSRGCFIDVQGSRSRRYLLSELTRSDDKRPDVEDAGGPLPPLSAQEISSYVFDPDADAETDQSLYEGFLCRGDLAVWLGREKHRKSNLILQFTVAAAAGRDFLGFRFVASRPLTVLLIDFESKSGSLRQRYGGITKAMGLSEKERRSLDANLKIIEVRRIRKLGRQFPKFSHKASQDTKFWDELVASKPADIYVVDPLRTLHTADENDSTIEQLLSEMQRVFRRAVVIAAHHMRKAGENSCTLAQDMRAWSEGARGSSAIKATSDVIVLQERSINSKGEEVVHLGSFLKDGPDIEPFPLMESDHESFYWEVVMAVPEHLQQSYEALTTPGGPFNGKSKVASELMRQCKVSKATAYRHIDAMIRARLLIEESGCFKVQTLKK
jgi:hypothetical protein